MDPELPYLVRNIHGYINQCLDCALVDKHFDAIYYGNQALESLRLVLSHCRKSLHDTYPTLFE